MLLQGHTYLNDVSARILALAGSPLKGMVSCQSARAHFRVALCGEHSKADRLLNAQFSRTKAFWIVWITITVSPYLITYFIRLATDPVWNQGCYGCQLNYIDFACLIAVNISNFILASSAYSFKLRKRDSLRILRECLLAMVIPLPILILFYILGLLDPNGTYANGGVSFASMTLIAPACCIYIITIHQVFVSREVKRSILFSDNVDRVDRFEDIMKDKELKSELQHYLHSELSGEILMFLDACNDVKAKFTENKNDGEAEARLVYGLFIEKNRAIYEVNLPSAIRESVALKMKHDLDSTIFDEAYQDVRGNFLRDGFPRFLAKMKRDPPLPRKRITVTTITSRVDARKASQAIKAGTE